MRKIADGVIGPGVEGARGWLFRGLLAERLRLWRHVFNVPTLRHVENVPPQALGQTVETVNAGRGKRWKGWTAEIVGARFQRAHTPAR